MCSMNLHYKFLIYRHSSIVLVNLFGLMFLFYPHVMVCECWIPVMQLIELIRYLCPGLPKLLLASAGYWCLAVKQLLFSDCMVHLCFFHTSPLHPKAYNPLLLVTFWLKRESTMHCLQMIIVPVSTYCCAAECLSCKRCICTTIFSSHLCKQFAAAFVCLLC